MFLTNNKLKISLIRYKTLFFIFLKTWREKTLEEKQKFYNYIGGNK